MKIQHRIPIFNKYIVIYVGKPLVKAYIADVKKTFGWNEEEIGTFAGIGGKSCGSFIWLDTPTLDVFAHEVSHFLDAMLDHLAVNDDETRAYLQGWIFKNVWPRLNKLVGAKDNITQEG